LTEKNRDAIKKFMEKDRPEEGECYLWVRDDVTMKVKGEEKENRGIGSEGTDILCIIIIINNLFSRPLSSR
jgi:hypothetical protein